MKFEIAPAPPSAAISPSSFQSSQPLPPAARCLVTRPVLERDVIATGTARVSTCNGREETAMNEQLLKGRWNEVKGKVKEKWGRLTNDELDQIDGNTDQLIGALQQRYGLAQEEARKELNAWMKSS